MKKISFEIELERVYGNQVVWKKVDTCFKLYMGAEKQIKELRAENEGYKYRLVRVIREVVA
jgi:hypothetical protein